VVPGLPPRRTRFGSERRAVPLNNGNRSVPTIVFPDGSRLVEPSNAELLRKLQSMPNAPRA
jgi:hypothetical protein